MRICLVATLALYVVRIGHNNLFDYFVQLLYTTLELDKAKGGYEMRRRLIVPLVCMVVVLLSGCGCDHEYDEGVVTAEPTCIETGVKTFTCTKCGEAYTEEVPVVDHAYEPTITKEPTFEEEGETTYTCTVCGDSYTEAIPVRDDPVTVTPYDKGVVAVDSKYAVYGLYPAVFLGMKVENRTEKDIKGVKGILYIYDMFGDVLTIDDGAFDADAIHAGEVVEYTTQWEVHPGDTDLQRLYDAKFDDLTFKFELEQVVYTDGTKDVFN